VQTLAQSVLEYIRRQKLLQAGDRVGIAVSGGADSVALLRLLLELRKELGIVLSVVHFNHKLRGAESDADEQFVAELARRNELELHGESGEVTVYASEKHLSREAAAREMRYEYFWRLLRDGVVNRMATAHTLDDQAETVLLKVVRGAGTRGLAGIYPQLLESRQSLRFAQGRLKTVVGRQEASIIRPLLATRRKDLEAYLAALGQEWREDSSNRDLRHARNRVRHGILPRLERNLNPAVREVLAETAEIARAEEEFWGQEVARVLPRVWEARHSRRDAGATESAGGVLKLDLLAEFPLALRRRIVRAGAEYLDLRLEFRQVEEILELASGGPGSARSAVLQEGWVMSRGKDKLTFEPSGEAKRKADRDYEYRFPVPGRIEVPEAATWFEAVLVSGNAGAGYNPEHSFDPALLAKELRVRNWRAGDRFWPAHTKSPRKIKELLQERHVTGTQRKLWPVVVSGHDIIWVRGFPAPAQLRPRDGAMEAVVIREVGS
jgi:tRNA(Ile)-lysidine synthase